MANEIVRAKIFLTRISNNLLNLLLLLLLHPPLRHLSSSNWRGYVAAWAAGVLCAGALYLEAAAEVALE